MPYFGLASGFLSGKYRTEADVQGKARAGAVSKYLNARGFAVIESLERVARELHATPATVALAWLNHQPTITSAIASATNQEQLDSLVQAATLKLDSVSLETLSRASQQAAPAD